MELAHILVSVLGRARPDTVVALAGVDEMTPTEARALIEEQAWDEGIWFIPVTASEGYLQQKLRALHSVVESLADQVEALEGQALSSVEREEYFAMKKDAERYRWLMADDGNASIIGRFHSVYHAWNGEDGADGFTAAIDRAREAT
jgi:hypothetical protein